MKILKSLLITLFALLLTGCYTQLQTSQKMNKITEKNKQEVKKKAPSEQEQTGNEVTEESVENAAGEDYVPIHYKDYEYANKYKDCKCSPYNVYNFYESPYGWYDYHRPYFSHRSHLSLHHSFYFNDWHHRHYFGYPRFAITFSWGSPYYYHRFYHDPFYYGYGYSPFAYNYHRYYGSFGYGYYYGGQKVRDNRRDDVKYGPRSIGTNRVSSGDRVRNENNRSTSVNSSSTTRTRSVGTARSQDTSRSSGAVSRTRSQDNTNTSSGNARTRSRDNDNERNNKRSVYIDRTDALPVVIDREKYNAIRARAAAESSKRSLNSSSNDLRKARTVNLNSKDQDKPTFFQRMREAFGNSTSRIITNGSRSSSTVRSRSGSSSNKSSVSRSKSSSNKSSVTRSKSSSSNSRSRGGSSSSSRSRSGGDSGSSSSDRSRGGN